jgi:hypothetical protein
MIKLGRVSKKTRGTPVVAGYVEDLILFMPGNRIKIG